MTCTPEELEKYHLELLKDDVKKTNEQYKLSIVEQEEQSARFRQSEEERKKRLEDVSSTDIEQVLKEKKPFILR